MDKGGNSHKHRMRRRNYPEVTIQKTVKTETPVVSRIPTRKRIWDIVGIVLAIVGISDVYPLWMNLSLYAIGFIIIILVEWKTATVESRKFSTKALRAFLLTVVYCVLIAYPASKQYGKEIDAQLLFKNDPRFGWWKKQITIHDVSKFRKYLKELAIPIPPNQPPFSISANGNQVGTASPPQLPIYRGEISVGDSAVHTRRSFTQGYCSYVMGSLLTDTLKNTVPDAIRVSEIHSSMCQYFDWSFWDATEELPWPWTRALWQIREKLGKEFTDRLASFTLRSMLDNPWEGNDPNLNVYFCRKLKIADSIIDNGASKWGEIRDTLKELGMPVDQM